MTDFAAYPEWAKGVQVAEVHEVGIDGRAEEVFFALDVAPIKDEYTLAYDWDGMLLRRGFHGHRQLYRYVELADPLAFTRAEAGTVFDGDRSLDAILDGLGAAGAAPAAVPASGTSEYVTQGGTN